MSKINESCRTYIFPRDELMVIHNVRELLVSKSGGHRLTTKDGVMYYIPFKWIGIIIASDRGWEA